MFWTKLVFGPRYAILCHQSTVPHTTVHVGTFTGLLWWNHMNVRKILLSHYRMWPVGVLIIMAVMLASFIASGILSVKYDTVMGLVGSVSQPLRQYVIIT